MESVWKVTGWFCWVALLGHEVVDGLFLLQSLLHLDEKADTVDYTLELLYFRAAQAVQVGDVKNAAFRCGINPAYVKQEIRKQRLKTIAIMTSQTQNFLIFWLLILDSKNLQIIF